MEDAVRPGESEGEESYLVVAVIRKPHGVRGELQLSLETDRPGAVFRRGRDLKLGDATGRPVGGALTVEKTRPMNGGLIFKPVGHTTREEVDAFRGRTLLIPASEAAPADSDEVPYHRLIGSSVIVGGVSIGTVREIVEAGGGQLLSVRRRRGGELLIPFVRELVVRVDPELREVEIDPPEGLLDL